MIDLLSKILIGILASWWLASMLYYGYGPLHIFERIRDRARGWIARELECFWCCAFWAGLITTPLLLVWWVLIPFALAGAVILLGQGGRLIWREMMEG